MHLNTFSVDVDVFAMSPGVIYLFYLIPPLFNQVGQLSSHLQLRPGQDRAKQCDTNNTELHMESTNVQSITQ